MSHSAPAEWDSNRIIEVTVDDLAHILAGPERNLGGRTRPAILLIARNLWCFSAGGMRAQILG